MSDTTYNGWTNRETWAVALHVNNDQGWQERVMELAQEYMGEVDLPGSPASEDDDVSGFRSALEQNVREIVDPAEYVETFGDISLSEWVKGPGMAARDIGDLDNVNWHELAESFLRDVRELAEN